MEYRAAKYTRFGMIDCEVNHPAWGWIPTTLSPNDPITSALFEVASQGVVADYVPPPPVTIEELRAGWVCSAAQARIALHRAGRLVAAESIVAADPELSIVWEYEATFHRMGDLFSALVAGGFTPEEIDDLFRATETI